MAEKGDGADRNRKGEQPRSDALSLAPLSFEEALSDLLKVAPPKGDEPPPERPRRAKPSQRQPKQDHEKGGR